MVDWLQLGQTGGTGDAYVLVQVPDNTSLIERNTTLTVSGFTKHATINVVQEGFEGEISVSPTELTASNASGTTTLHITANTAYSLYSKPNWVMLNSNAGTSGVTTVTATIAANTGSTQRSGNIVWKCNDFSATASTQVTQLAAVPTFTISPTVIERSSDSGTSIVRITTNGTWEITSASSWFSVAPYSGNSSSTGFTLTFNENQTAADLTGSVVVKHVQTDTPYTVSVTQSSARTVGIADCVYSASSTTRVTQLYYDEGNIVFMEVDGGAIEPATSAVTFTTTGLHNVKFYLNNTQIMSGQFGGLPLVSINLSNINTLSDGSFGWCKLLTGFTSSTITRIDTGAVQPGSFGTSNPFEETTALTEFHGSASNIILDGKGFVVGDKLYSIAAGYGTSFDTSVLPSGIRRLGGGWFSQNWNTALSIHIDSNITELERLAFYYLPYLTAATFSSSATLTVIPQMSFFGCHHLTSVIVPDSVVRVDEMAFAECFRLTAVTFGTSVQYIGYGENMAPGNATTFSPIKSITCKSMTAPTISNVVGYPSFFIRSAAPNSGGNKNGTVHYPSGADYSSWENSEPFASDGTWTFVADA